MMATFLECHCNSGTISDCPIHDPKKSGPAIAEMLDLSRKLRRVTVKWTAVTNDKGRQKIIYELSLEGFGYAFISASLLM
jgi:hypothetical protein